MGYTPNPIDLTAIKIDEVPEEDIERIARNIHETWAKQRVAQGWEYGERYANAPKTHPCLVEYEDLPESEREMDRATVTQTIKMLRWLGYTIEKQEDRVRGRKG